MDQLEGDQIRITLAESAPYYVDFKTYPSSPFRFIQRLLGIRHKLDMHSFISPNWHLTQTQLRHNSAILIAINFSSN